ncbi:MAG TPA: tetratricopeptide repeat protein [Actinomycetes bacterium]
MAAVTALVGLLTGNFLLAGRGRPLQDRTAPPAATSSTARVAQLQDELRARPGEPRLLAELGIAYLTRARETADPTWYAKADRALRQSQAARPGQARTMIALGLLDLARHDFRAALAWGERAHRASPDAAEPLGVLVDAQVELGRYDDALASVQRMVDLRPDLPSLARVSYLRELHGDAAGALEAMRQAVTAGAGAPGDVAYLRTIVGDLQLGAGRLGDAEAAYREALAGQPGYGAAEVGVARVAAARGHLAAAARQLDAAAQRLPLPGTVGLLGDVQAALGHHAEAARQYRLVRAIEQLNRANGVAVDLELARFEADHARQPGGDPARAVAMARRARVARPTVYADDALAWALRQAGRAREALPHARAALRLGTRDALLWYHLAAVEADLGMTAPARQHLATALAINPYVTGAAGTIGERPAALALAKRLGVRVPAPGAVG